MPSWYLLKKLKRALQIQSCVNSINRAASSAISPVPEFNGEIFTYSGENSMTVVLENIRDQDRYVRSILSDMKPMKTLTEEQQLQHATATTCEPCHANSLRKIKIRNITTILSDFTLVLIAIRAIWNWNRKRSQLQSDWRKEKESITKIANQVLQRYI